MFSLCLIAALVVPYLICSVNPAIIVSKVRTGSDIRSVGSGNPGLTNTLRTQGKAAALTVLLLDVLKGVISIMIVRLLFYYVWGGGDIFKIESLSYIPWVAALASVMGHVFPIYYGFKGGKAVLVTVSVMFVIDWISALILLTLFIFIVMFTRYVSLGSIIAAAMMPICVYLIGVYAYDKTNVLIDVGYTAIMASLLIFKHLENINRLINKKEKKLGDKRG